MEKRLFTSESVTEGHPDKICDQISDAVLDALMEQDPMSRVACETAITTGLVLVMGEITTKGYVDIQKIVRDTVREIGYDRGKYGFDSENCGVITAIDEQSTDIAMGVDKALEAKEHKMSEAVHLHSHLLPFSLWHLMLLPGHLQPHDTLLLYLLFPHCFGSLLQHIQS